MKTSDQINELAGALAKAQGAMNAAVKDSKNPHLGNKYADLASVWDAARKPLSDNGLAVIQSPENVVVKSRQYVERKRYDKNKGSSYTTTDEVIDATITILTRITHASGQWIENELEMPILEMDPQKVGSVITYGRRYALAAMVGITQDDDDGNAGSNVNGPRSNQQQQQKPPAAQPSKPPDNSGQKRTTADTKPAAPAPATKPETPPAENNGYINAILQSAKDLNMSELDLKYAVKELLGSSTLKGLDNTAYRKLIVFLNGLADDGITFADWKAQRQTDDDALAAEIGKNMPDLPDFPVA